ncbi:MAG: hypothetical protein Q7U75_19080, partial [Desulfobacterales bacterium]|nr:hypothetical protein [Desulfobacterales bacterium]
WNGKRLLPADFVAEVGITGKELTGVPVANPKEYGNASNHYGLLWWNNADGALKDVPRDAYWSWGLYDSLIVVMPSLDIVVARAGQSWKRSPDEDHYAVLAPFLGPIATSVRQGADDLLERKTSDGSERSPKLRASGPPCPPSPIISRVVWAPANTIVRKARGSDNWPLTWADDDQLYTAYGDGKGFEPFIDRKLSLGLARISGGPEDFAALNLRAPSVETLGDGAKGKKASGLLMVDGTLYLLARNAVNSQLAWSSDHGHAWTWSEWKWTESFGCPTFLNIGRNYAGARDAFVYVYSHDSDSAYEPADRMVLARVPQDRIRQRNAYEFFSGLTADGAPVWDADISRRAAVFTYPGRCYRSGISW